MKSRNQGVALSYVNTVLNMVTGFFLSSFFVKMLGDTEYGLYQMVTSFVSYLVLLEFGTGTAMTRNISKCRAQNADKQEIQKNISTIWTISLLLAIIIAVASIVFYSQIGNIYNKLTFDQVSYAQKILLLEVVYLIVSFLSSTLNGVVLGFEQYKLGPIISIVRLISRAALMVGIILIYRYAIAIVIVDVLVSITTATYLFVFCIRRLRLTFTTRYFDRQVFKEILPLCMAMFIQTLVNQANSSVDQFVIGIKMTPEHVSYYSIGLFFYNAFSLLTTVPITMYGPQIVKDIIQKVNEDTLMDHMIRPSRFITLIGTTALCGFFVAGRQFINLCYGENYKIVWFVALIIMVPMMINMSNGILINVLDALNKRMARSYVLMFTTIANIILTVVWIDIWGIIGASIATAVCTLVGQITMMNVYYSKKLNIKIMYLYYRTFKGILIPQLIATAIAFILGNTLRSNFISLIISGCIYITIFSFLFLKFGMQESEREIVSAIKNKLQKKNN